MSEEGKIFSRGKSLNTSIEWGNTSGSKWELLFNGQSIEPKDGYVYKIDGCEEEYWIEIENSRLYQEIISHTATEVMKDIACIDFKLYFDFNDNVESFYLSHIVIIKIPKRHSDYENFRFFFLGSEDLYELSKNGKYIICFLIATRMDNWKNPWSVKEHVKELSITLNESELKNGIQKFGSVSEPTLDFGLMDFQILRLAQGYNCNGSPLNIYIDKCIHILTKAQTEVLEKYQRESFTETIARQFNFPPEVKTACKQYLLYFTEFLQDME